MKKKYSIPLIVTVVALLISIFFNLVCVKRINETYGYSVETYKIKKTCEGVVVNSRTGERIKTTEASFDLVLEENVTVYSDKSARAYYNLDGVVKTEFGDFEFGAPASYETMGSVGLDGTDTDGYPMFIAKNRYYPEISTLNGLPHTSYPVILAFTKEDVRYFIYFQATDEFIDTDIASIKG